MCLYVDDLIFIRSNPRMFDKFKKEMTQEFEIADIGLMVHYLGIEVKQKKKKSSSSTKKAMQKR